MTGKGNKKENERGLVDNENYFIKLWLDVQDNKLKKLFLVSLDSKTVNLDDLSVYLSSCLKNIV